VLDWYLAAVALPAVGAFHLGDVLVDLDPTAVALRLGAPGSPSSATALLRAEPVAVGAGAAPLAAQLRTHAEAFVAVFGPQFRFSRRACWAAVTDQVDTAFLTAGWVSGEQDRAAAEAAAVLGADEAGSWLPVPAGRRCTRWSTSTVARTGRGGGTAAACSTGCRASRRACRARGSVTRSGRLVGELGLNRCAISAGLTRARCRRFLRSGTQW
jgi:hypothetical protein